MSIELNIDGKTAIHAAAASIDNGAPAAQMTDKILDGKALTVTSAAASDLEKLVARLKNETGDVRLSVAQRRISILQTVLDSMADRISETERTKLVEIEMLNGEKAAANLELSGLKTDKTSLELKIEELDRAIERALQEGEDHRERVEELKAQRAEEQEKLDRVENAIASAAAKISGIDAKIAECTRAIAATTLNEVAAAMRIAAGENAPSQAPAGRAESDADRAKEEVKAQATDVANIISEALDKIDAQILAALDEAQVVKA
ncbi:MAG: hypothetical protein ILO34_07235 [Kiritimatiellae bacterium]|nr:hypothetical protein [Kiritimatiellia bacterium]